MWHSAHFRHTLLLLAVFISIDVLSLGAAYLKLRSDLAEELQAELVREAAGFDLTATPRALSAIVAARARVTDPVEMVMVFLRSDGGQVGNVRASMRGGSVALVPLEGGEPLSPAGYARDTRELSGGILILGISLDPLSELKDTFLALFVISILPTAAFSLLVSIVVGRRNARRVTAVESTLDRLTGGDLTARTDTSGSDDLARIASGVNRLALKQQKSTAALRQVSADIAHDLKTPLQRVSALLEELKQRLDDQDAATIIADQAAEEIRRSVSIFNAIMRIASVEGSNLDSEFKQIDLAEIARSIAELYEPSLEDAGKSLEIDIPGRPILVRGDPELLGQAVSNLIENALVHTTGKARVRVTLENTSSNIRLIVSDTGEGIPADELAKVTQRFYRLERSRSTPGHGLGLSLVGAIAELHSARLELSDNKPGLLAAIVFPAGL